MHGSAAGSRPARPQQARIGRPLGLGDQLADAVVEHIFMHPAAGKGIQGQHVTHDAELVEVILPAALLGLFLGVGTRRPSWFSRTTTGLSSHSRIFISGAR
jgi:hypothetical protein